MGNTYFRYGSIQVTVTVYISSSSLSKAISNNHWISSFRVCFSVFCWCHMSKPILFPLVVVVGDEPLRSFSKNLRSILVCLHLCLSKCRIQCLCLEHSVERLDPDVVIALLEPEKVPFYWLLHSLHGLDNMTSYSLGSSIPLHAFIISCS